MKNQSKKAIFSIGTPGSGKSTILKNLYQNENFRFLDCDSIKEKSINYNPKKPELLHDWSKKELEKEFKKTLKKGNSFIYDTCNCNIEKAISRIEKAKAKGYYITLIYVKVKLSIAIKRNKQRQRQVKKSIILDKYSKIKKAFKVLSQNVNEFKVINNNKFKKEFYYV